MIPSATLRKFIADGTKPTTDREKTALLDECRSLFAEVAAGRRKITTAETGPTSGVMACFPSAVPKATAKDAAPATETEREKLHREMAAIEDPAKRRAFRLRNWNTLAGPIKAPSPRKTTK